MPAPCNNHAFRFVPVCVPVCFRFVPVARSGSVPVYLNRTEAVNRNSETGTGKQPPRVSRLKPMNKTNHNPTPNEQARAAALIESWRPWIESEARDQAMKETRAFVLVQVGDLLDEPEPPAFIQRQVETAYRRGYWHGFSRALDALIQAGAKRSAAWERVAGFFDGPLKRWRYATKPKAAECPPRFTDRTEVAA